MIRLISTLVLVAAISFFGAAASLVSSDAIDPPSVQKSGDNRIVFVTKTGEKYHLADCSSLSKSRIPMKLGDARRDYRPCTVCKPPR